MNDFIAWCQRKRLILNTQKTVGVNFYNRRPITAINIATGNISIPLTDNIKYLGTTIDANLSWSTCIDKLCSKLRSSYFAILNLKDSFDEQTVINTYYSLCYSHISIIIIKELY